MRARACARSYLYGLDRVDGTQLRRCVQERAVPLGGEAQHAPGDLFRAPSHGGDVAGNDLSKAFYEGAMRVTEGARDGTRLGVAHEH